MTGSVRAAGSRRGRRARVNSLADFQTVFFSAEENLRNGLAPVFFCRGTIAILFVRNGSRNDSRRYAGYGFAALQDGDLYIGTRSTPFEAVVARGQCLTIDRHVLIEMEGLPGYVPSENAGG